MLDILFLRELVQELKSDLINARVDKIYQPSGLELTLTLRNPGETLNLRIDCNAHRNNFRITNQLPQNPSSPSSFCMLLRKYLIGSKINDLVLVNNERIINVILQGRHPEGYVTQWILAVELMGKHSNVVFFHAESRSILGVMKSISTSVRELQVGKSYQLPPSQGKIPLTQLNLSNLLLKTLGEDQLTLDKIIVKYLPLSSPIIANEFLYKFKLHNLTLSDLNDDQISEFILNYKHFIKNLNYEPVLYCHPNTNEVHDFYCTRLESTNNPLQIYPSYKKLVQHYYDLMESQSTLQSFKSNLNKIIGKHQKRLNKKLKVLSKELAQYESSDQYKETGDLIMSNLHQIKKGMQDITLFNYYTSDMETIKLDPSLSPIANSQAYYKRHSKAKRGLEIVRSNVKSVEDELNYLDSLSHFISFGDLNELKDIEQELVKGGYITPAKQVKSQKKQINVLQSEPMEFTSSNGYKVMVGKNNRQNDFLTFKVAKNKDLWFHTKDIAGSHVIVKDGLNAPEDTLLEAAALAAFYSKARQSGNVAVDYTEVKNVFKPKGAKPGMVNYFEFKTIYVTPKEDLIDNIKNR